MKSFIQQLRRRKTNFTLTDAEQSGLHRALGVKDLALFGIAAIIGGGIFSSVGEACAKGGPGVIFLFIICAVVCGFAAMCYAEFASRIPIAGSAYTYAYASFGELFAWIIGWALLMEYCIGNIYVSYAWSGYFTNLMENCGVIIPSWLCNSFSAVHDAYIGFQEKISGLSGADLQHYLNENKAIAKLANTWNSAPIIGGLRIIVDLPAFIINILITCLVYIGIKESRNFSNAMVIIKIAIVLFVIVVGIFYIKSDNYVPFTPTGFTGIMGAVSAVFFTYIGFDAVSTMAEESKNPERDLPKGMIYSLIFCTVLYIVITLVLTGMVNYKKFAGVNDPLAMVLSENNIKWLEFIVSVGAVIAMTSVMLVYQMGQPRIWMSMSRDGLLPKKFSTIHAKFKTPSFATIITGIVVGIPILFTNKNFVLDFTSIGTLFAFVLVCGGVLLLPPNEEKKYKFRIPYINSAYYFPIIIFIILICINIFAKGYFSSVFDYSFLQTNLEHSDKISKLTYNISHTIFWFIAALLFVYAIIKKWSLIPLLGVLGCLYLLTGMTANNWLWFFIWFGIGLVVYFMYGFRRSKIKDKR